MENPKESRPFVYDPGLGDEGLVRSYSLTVQIRARERLDRMRREREMLGDARPFTHEEMARVYDEVDSEVRRRRKEEADAISSGAVVGELRALADRVLERMESVPCGGRLDETLDQRCPPETERACEWRRASWCPRTVRSYEKTVREAQGIATTPAERLRVAGVPRDLIHNETQTGVLDKRWTSRHRAVRLVAAWLAAPSRPPFLLLAGGVGNGKSTSAAWAIAREGGVWVSSYELAAKSRNQEFVHNILTATPLLVLDEIGAEDLTESAKAVFNRVVYERGASRTILTCNVDRETVLARYTDRFVDRIAPGTPGSAKWAQWVPGPSLRGSEPSREEED